MFIDYYPSLISFALYYVGDKTIAEDLVQEVFVKLWETRERWSAVGDFSAYVYQMVRFKCFNYLRAEKIRNEATRSFTEEVDITEINNYIAEETFRFVMNSMEDLPPACRTVFSLTLEGYSAKEIAEKLDIAVETVKKQKQIARKILKEKFGKLFLFLPAVLFSYFVCFPLFTFIYPTVRAFIHYTYTTLQKKKGGKRKLLKVKINALTVG